MPRKKGRSHTKKRRFDVDLHMHSTCSDGELSPEQLVTRAQRRNLKAIAITDQDSVESYESASSSAASANIHLIPGTEISAQLHREIHILGLFIEPQNPALKECLKRLTQGRISRVHAICKRLREHGIDLDAQTIIEDAEGNVGRPHIAKAMVQGKHVATFNDAFEKYLGRRGKAYVENEKLSAEHAIDLIHAAGGVAILAHPGVEKLSSHFPELKAMGLDGIEVNHPAHGSNIRASLRSQAKKLGFLISGGSDMHNHQSACKLGDLGISESELAFLMERANQHRRKQGIGEYSYGTAH